MNSLFKTYAVKMLTACTILLVLALVYAVVTVKLPQTARHKFASIETDEAVQTAKHQQAKQAGNVSGHASMENSSEAQDRQYRTGQLSDTAELTEKSATAARELKMVLLCTVPGKPSFSRVIIKDSETDTLNPHKTGQQTGGVCIYKVEKDRVIITRGGRTYVLNLEPGHPTTPTTTTQAAGSQVQSFAVVQDQSPEESSEAVLAFDDQSEPQIPVRSLGSILQIATTEHCEIQGEVQGLMLKGVGDILVASDTGLKDGDVIHQVNGHRLINRQQAWQVLKKAESQETIEIQVLQQN
jgi:type II secretory pathway component PulC